MKRIFTLSILFLSFLLISTQAKAQCDYSLELYDSFGDGWNGASIQVSVNSVPIAGSPFTFTTGSISVVPITGLSNGDILGLQMLGLGSFPGEVSWSLFNTEGSLVFNQPATAPLTLQTFTVNCPPCAPPNNFNVTNLTATSADINWGAGAGLFFNMEYGPAGFVPGTGTQTGSYSGINTTFSATGLTPATAYSYYVSSICPNGDTVNFIGPNIFSTPFLAPDGVACITGGSSILFSADFENTAVSGTPVGWTGSFGTFNAWEVTPPNTNSFNTGPNIAVSGAQHLEFQAGTNSTAAVTTPPINLTTANDEVELSFYMHAFGTGMGTFSVGASTSAAGPFTQVFTYTGNLQTTAVQAWEHIAVDLTAYLGQTIYLQFNNTSSTFLGDVAIDLIEIRSCVTCPSPTNFSASNITDSSVDLAWTGGGAAAWLVQYGPSGFTPGNADSTFISINPTVTITGLNSATEYDFYVYDFCAVGDTSIGVGPLTESTNFLTPDGVACITGGSSILFTADFENTAVSGTPAGWSGSFGTFNAWEVTPSNTNSFNTGPNIPVSGVQHIEFQAGTNSNAAITTPPINLTTANDEVELSFYMHAFGTGMGTFTIGASTSPSGPFTPVFSYSGDFQTSATQAWEHVAVDLTAFLGQTIYLQFNNTSTTFLGDVALDLIEVRSCVTCPAPTNFAASNVTSSSIDLAWTSGGAPAWLVEFGPSGFLPGNGDSTFISINPNVTVTGLSSSTLYDFYVYDFCAVGDTSIPVGPLTEATDFLAPDGVACITGDSFTLFSEDFEIPTNSIPSGWIGNFGTFNAWEVTNANANSFGTGPNISVSGNQHIEFQAGTNSSGSVVSPAINLTTSNDEVELSFFMHAFGDGMGSFNINVGNSQAGPFTPVFNYTGDLQTSATQAWEHIAVDLTAFIGQTIYLQFSNTSTAFRGDISIDRIEVRSCITCPAPSNVTTSNVTETSVEVDWTTGGASVWLVEYGPAGFVPGNGDSTIIAPFDSLVITGLNASSVYDVFVYDLCAVGDTSFGAGPERFFTDCDTVMAPYYESFDFALADPHCWTSAGAEPWLYRNSLTVGGFPAPGGGVANSADHTTGTGNYAWIDASGNPGINSNELESPVIDYSGLTQGIVGCWVKSNNTSNATQNRIQIEAWNGTAWDSVANYSGNFDGWRRFYEIIPASIPTTTSFRLVQFQGVGASVFNNDILVDDFFVEEAPTCFNSVDLTSTVLSPTQVELSWTAGSASNWIIEYGAPGFIQGTGTSVSTNQNPFILDVNSGQEYDWYVRDSCSATDISWYSYVDNFRMPGEVECDSTFTNFTFCYEDNLADEIYTYQSSNSTSFLHVEFNSGIINSGDDFFIYDGPDETFPILFSSGGTLTNMTGVEFTSSSNIISFSYNTLFFPNSGCTTPLDFDINCCENTFSNQVVYICVDSTTTLADGQIVGGEGSYNATIENFKGCDSLINYLVFVIPDSTDFVGNLCVGDVFVFADGTSTNVPGQFQATTQNVNGCDSTINYTLNSISPSSFTMAAEICQGEAYLLPDGVLATTAGNYTSILTNEVGCDSVITTTLTVNQPTTGTQNAQICDGQEFELPNGVTATTTGTYTSVITNFNGCDSTVTTNLTVAMPSSSDVVVEICGEETYTLINGDEVDESGEYNISISNAAGCDSIVTVFVSKCNAISDLDGDEILSIHPNPAMNELNVILNDAVVNNANFKIINAVGQTIFEQAEITENAMKLDVSKFSNGMYFIVLSDTESTSLHKFIVSK